MSARRRETVTVTFPESDIAEADARLSAIIRRCSQDANIVESVARSCYLQGVCDGVALALEHPELLAGIQGESPEVVPPSSTRTVPKGRTP
jgi:hypothetical protein